MYSTPHLVSDTLPPSQVGPGGGGYHIETDSQTSMACPSIQQKTPSNQKNPTTRRSKIHSFTNQKIKKHQHHSTSKTSTVNTSSYPLASFKIISIISHILWRKFRSKKSGSQQLRLETSKKDTASNSGSSESGFKASPQTKLDSFSGVIQNRPCAPGSAKAVSFMTCWKNF